MSKQTTVRGRDEREGSAQKRQAVWNFLDSPEAPRLVIYNRRQKRSATSCHLHQGPIATDDVGGRVDFYAETFLPNEQLAKAFRILPGVPWAMRGEQGMHYKKK